MEECHQEQKKVCLRYFYIEDVKEPAKEGEETACKTAGKSCHFRKHEEKFGLGFPSLGVNVLRVVGFCCFFFLPEWKAEQLGKLASVLFTRHEKKGGVCIR